MYHSISENGVDKFHVPMNHGFNSIIFILVVISCKYFMTNFFIGVVVSSFEKEKEKLSKDYMLMEN